MLKAKTKKRNKQSDGLLNDYKQNLAKEKNVKESYKKGIT